MKLRSFVGIALVTASALPATASAQWFGLTASEAWEYSVAFGDVGRSISATKLMGLRNFATMDKRFTVGWGLRGSFIGGDNLPHMGRGNERDTLLVTNPGVAALNLMLMGTARLNSDIEIGANFDLVGVSLGADKRANLHATNGSLSGAYIATVTNINIFGFGTGSHRGSMQSEVYLQYGVNTEWKLKFGLNKAWTDYQTDLIVNGSRRFRSSANGGFIGMRYTPQ